MSTHLEAKPAGTPTWTDLVTPDVEQARAFYHAVFGWDYEIGNAEFGGYTTARLGKHSTAGLMGNQPEAELQPTAWGLYFATNNIEADDTRAVELGARLLSPPMAVGNFGSMATYTDPTGAMFSLWQADQHVGWQVINQPGAVAWHELYTPDAKAACDFYAALLGASVEPMPGELEYYTLNHANGPIAGIMQIDPAWGAMPAQWVNYFLVTNIDETVATVLKHGGKSMGPIDDSPFGRIAALADPGGATFKIVEEPAG